MSAANAQRVQAVKGYPIKAAFLYNFTKYVEWPAGAHTDSKSPIVITILGKNPFDSALETIVEGRSANGRPVVVKYARTVEAIPPTHILFIANSEDPIVSRLLENLKGKPILTVGESDRFRAAQGMINFFIEENQVRFEINMGPIEAARLKMSSQLQKLSKKAR